MHMSWHICGKTDTAIIIIMIIIITCGKKDTATIMIMIIIKVLSIYKKEGLKIMVIFEVHNNFPRLLTTQKTSLLLKNSIDP